MRFQNSSSMFNVVCMKAKFVHSFFILLLFLIIIFLTRVKNNLFEFHPQFDYHYLSKCWSAVNHEHGYWPLATLSLPALQKSKQKINKHIKRKKKNSASIFNSFILILTNSRRKQDRSNSYNLLIGPGRVHISYLRTLGYAEKVHILARL